MYSINQCTFSYRKDEYINSIQHAVTAIKSKCSGSLHSDKMLCVNVLHLTYITDDITNNILLEPSQFLLEGNEIH